MSEMILKLNKTDVGNGQNIWYKAGIQTHATIMFPYMFIRSHFTQKIIDYSFLNAVSLLIFNCIWQV